MSGETAIICNALTFYFGNQLSQAGTAAKRRNIDHAKSLLEDAKDTLAILNNWTDR
jgi:hypothetical protein